MATKQPTQLCYQVNGGTCRNKVSAKNSYVCAAGHRTTKGVGRDEIATQLSVEAIRKMKWVSQCKLAENPSIDRDIAQALFETENWAIRERLAKNPSIDRDMAIQLANCKQIPVGYLINKSIEDLCAQENVSLIDQYPKEFAEAYLYQLLVAQREHKDEDETAVKALALYSYSKYRKSDVNKWYMSRILAEYPKDEELNPPQA